MHSTMATEIGIMSALRTGDPVRDLAMCAAVPLAMDRVRESPHTASSLLEKVQEVVGDLLAGGRQYTTHSVELLEQHSDFGEINGTNIKAIDDADHRDLLFRAVGMYVSDRVSLRGQSGRYALFATNETEKLEASLRADPLLAKQQQSQVKHIIHSNRELTELSVMPLAPNRLWIPLDNGLELRYSEVKLRPQTKERESIYTVHKTFTLRSRAADAPHQMRAFFTQAFEYYQTIEKRKVDGDKKRYLFVRDTSSGGGSKDSAANAGNSGGAGGRSSDKAAAKKTAPPFKRYALGEEKTFDTVFFNEKPAVLKLLNDFINKTGKFAIDGFPNKLGLLLHGPPGTGKTSVIKAIAQYTKRHIVSISLSKIQTNQELLDAMTDLRFSVQGLDLPLKLTYDDVVFVMEDVDCASSVVQTRNENLLNEETYVTNGETQPLVLLAKLLGEEELLMEHGLVASSNQNDKLNLAGLLNVLDGVIDCPGRIVVMTTNHPEKLDPALVRPGRVNKKIYMGCMPAPQIQKMVEYYFDTSLEEQQIGRVFAVPETMTPAEVEEICAEFDDVDDAIDALGTNASLATSTATSAELQ